MATAELNTPLLLKDLKSVSASMKNLVLNSLGPKGQKVIVTSSSGQTIITKDGATILLSLHFSHPIARCILKNIRSFNNIYGDCCKTYVIYLYHLLEAIESEQNRCKSQISYTDTQFYCKAISKCLHNFLNEDFIYLTEQLKTVVYHVNKIQITNDKILMKPALINLLTSFSSGMFSNEVTNHLVKLLATYMATNQARQINSLTHQWLDKLVFFNKNSYMQSNSQEGIFLCGHIFFKFHCSERTNAVMVQCQIDGAKDNSTSDAAVFSFQMSDQVFMYKLQTVKLFFSALKDNNVTLILTPHLVPDYILQLADELCLNVVSCLDDSDMEFLMCATGKIAVTNIWDELNSSFFFLTRSYDSIYIGDKHFIKIELDQQPQHILLETLFLFAPTEGHIMQLKSFVEKSFILISHCLPQECSKLQFVGHVADIIIPPLNDKSPQYLQKTEMIQLLDTNQWLDIIAGGGYFEYLLSYIIQKYVATNPQLSHDTKNCCQLLSKMLLALPQILHQNLSVSHFNKDHSYLSVYSTVNSALNDSSVVGFCSSAVITNPLLHGLWESLDVKLAAVVNVVSLVEKLLCVDSIVGVTALSHVNFSDIKTPFDSNKLQ